MWAADILLFAGLKWPPDDWIPINLQGTISPRALIYSIERNWSVRMIISKRVKWRLVEISEQNLSCYLYVMNKTGCISTSYHNNAISLRHSFDYWSYILPIFCPFSIEFELYGILRRFFIAPVLLILSNHILWWNCNLKVILLR